MIHTDKYYVRPTIYKMTTNFSDKLIQLDSWATTFNYKWLTTQQPLPNTYLYPVSFVSSNAGVYPSLDHVDISPIANN